MATFKTIPTEKELCVEYFIDDEPAYGFWSTDAKDAAKHIRTEFSFMRKRLTRVRVNGFSFTNNPPAPILQQILDNVYKP